MPTQSDPSSAISTPRPRRSHSSGGNGSSTSGVDRNAPGASRSARRRSSRSRDPSPSRIGRTSICSERNGARRAVLSARMADPEAPALERLADIAALERPAEAKRMLVIVNPYATTMSDRLKHLVVYALQGRYDVTAVDTQRKGHAIDLVAEAAREEYDVVVAFGGDGTVNEAANGLAGTGTPLTCLPGGSTNVVCRTLGIPNDVVDATEHLLALPDHWAPRAVDLGMV